MPPTSDARRRAGGCKSARAWRDLGAGRVL